MAGLEILFLVAQASNGERLRFWGILLPILGSVCVAAVSGVFGVLTNRAKTAAQASAADAESYAVALKAKAAAIEALQEQVAILEHRLQQLET